MYRFGFILEQTLGHITHSRNLKEAVQCDPEVEPYWALPAWNKDDLIGKMLLSRSNWTLQAGLRARKAVHEMARAAELDALFFHTQVTAVLLPDWLKRIPSIISLDATPRQYDRLGDAYVHRTGPAWLEQWKWKLNRDCFQHARHLVAWSEWARQGLIDEYEVPPDKVTVLPPGVDVEAWTRPTPRSPRQVVKILFVGGDLDRKGGRLLLEAFYHLQAALAVQTAPAFERQANEEPAVLELHLVTRTRLETEPGVFVYSDIEPNSPGLKRLYFNSDIFCLPSQGDCLPMVLSEAGAAGLPTVSSRLAAIPEIIQDGKTGLLVPPGDLEALIAAIQQLILNPDLRLRLGHQAEQHVRQKYDARRNANQLLEIMKKISTRKPAGKTAQ